MSDTRDLGDAYMQARIVDYRTYRKAGQRERAEQVARVLKVAHGYDVTESDGADPKRQSGLEKSEVNAEPEAAEAETTVADPMPEAAVEPKPARRPGRPRQSGK